jgi:protein-disulfide isomerase
MVLCILALPVFAVLSIFSVRYRKLTRDALECLFRTATLRKCSSGLDDRIRSNLTGKVMKHSPRTAGFLYRHYKIISWVILLLFLWSVYASSVGVYNYTKYGNCNGPSSDGFCIFDPTGAYTGTSQCQVPLDVDLRTNTTPPSVDARNPVIGSADAELTIIEFGCYSCEYTARAEPVVHEVLDYYKGRVNLQFKTMYLPNHAMSLNTSIAADCVWEQGAYPAYHTLLFENQQNMTQNLLYSLAASLPINTTRFDECMVGRTYENQVKLDTLEGVHAGVLGTPTFFINNRTIVGPKPFKTFKTLIDEEIGK